VLRDLLERAPRRGMAWYLLARVRYARGDSDAMIDFLRKAIAEDQSLPMAHNDLGILLQTRGRFEEAESCYRRAIEIAPQFAEPMSNLGALLAARGRVEDAKAWYNQAIAADSQLAPAHNNLGAALARLDRPDEAVNCHRQAIVLKPDFAEAHYNLGVALQSQARFEEALASYDKAVAFQRDYIDAHWSRALVLLAIGRFAEGWLEHEWRWRRKQQPPRSFSQPLWRGEPLEGRTILLHAEQGIGDTLQFIRYVPYVVERGARVIVQVHPSLVRLLSAAYSDRAQVISEAQPPPDFDVHVPLLSLPLAFATTLETIPAAVPYLAADSALAARWRERLGQERAFKVGVVWAGNPQHTNDYRRSMGLDCLLPLFDATPSVRWFSLQVGERSTDLTKLPAGTITSLTDKLTDFSETAAAIAGLDLIITVDTAAAHLAGALGKPVWLMLPFVPDWRWLLDRDDSPWYPTARLFRQAAPGNWTSVVDRVKFNLRDCLSRPRR